jgi:hypothetical protein
MEIEQNSTSGEISIHQKQYIMNILRNYNTETSRKCSTQLDPGQKFEKCGGCDECKNGDLKLYQSMIGSLLYLSISTRPGIAYSVNKLSQFNTNPHQEHFTAIKHIIRYLCSTINYKITYMKTNKSIEGFVDSDWAGDYGKPRNSKQWL